MRKYFLLRWTVMFFACCGPVALSAQISPPASAQAAAPLRLVKEPYTFRTYDGQDYPAELFTLTVPARPTAPARPGRPDSVRLKFVRLRTTAMNPRSPLV